jgi:hypothetical protein
MKALAQPLTGCVLIVFGLAVTAYSFPFVTWVALTFFLLGIVLQVTGVWLILRRVRRAL